MAERTLFFWNTATLLQSEIYHLISNCIIIVIVVISLSLFLCLYIDINIYYILNIFICEVYVFPSINYVVGFLPYSPFGRNRHAARNMHKLPAIDERTQFLSTKWQAKLKDRIVYSNSYPLQKGAEALCMNIMNDKISESFVELDRREHPYSWGRDFTSTHNSNSMRWGLHCEVDQRKPYGQHLLIAHFGVLRNHAATFIS